MNCISGLLHDAMAHSTYIVNVLLLAASKCFSYDIEVMVKQLVTSFSLLIPQMKPIS